MESKKHAKWWFSGRFSGRHGNIWSIEQHITKLPRFSILANLCRSAGFCKNRCTESWRSIQICKIFEEVCRFSLKIFAEICFSAASKEPLTAFLDFFNYFINYFSWPRLSHVILSITQNSREENFVPITVVMVTGEWAVLVLHCNLSISRELCRCGCWTLRSSFASLTLFWLIKFDMWQPSGLVDVLIKCCCCNISGTWFVGVILIISGNSNTL